MGLWMLLLLHLHLGNAHWGEATGVSLSAPSSVSISSINLEHALSFQPGPQTPSDARFMVEVIRSRKQSWKPVPACVALRAGQTCDLTRAFKDPFDHYVARVQAFTATQRSSWTVSDSFQPLSDTVIGPPDVAVSGCGNCLILHLTLPEVLASEHLKDSHTDLIFHVRRTRDGAEFTLHMPYSAETVISYLQTGVEYCVTASVRPHFSKAIPSEPQCAFTSPPPRNLLYMLVVLLGAFCALAFLLVALVIYGSRLTFSVLKTRLPKSLSYVILYRRGSAPPGLSPQNSHDDCSSDRLKRSHSEKSV
ncbi:interferon alpha/beta receptor 2 isoform X1 [Oreochromis niloticus]|uniref:interferon alpha/beta receptor 2 isoform X1 n=1 Tax=Oreochromis niloticus TaxID=8128 RepID=UPI00067460E6|nr:interferon alpha/beta receptor 2 isoform X1 [Oreochromis niloticus]